MNKLIIFGILALLSGCASEEQIQVHTVQVPVKIIPPSDPTPVTLIKPVWHRINSNQIELDTKDFKNLMIDLSDLERYISQQRNEIDYYKEMTK